MASRTKRPTNHGSILLEDHENRTLFQLLGQNNYALVSGVAQLLAAEPQDRTIWHKRYTGVICLTKDYTNRGYFLQMYDLELGKIWQQQLYDHFKTRAPAPYLLTFEGDDCVFGLNFSNVQEAGLFKTQLDRRYQTEVQKKRQSANLVKRESHHEPSPSPKPSLSPPPPPVPTTPIPPPITGMTTQSIVAPAPAKQSPLPTFSFSTLTKKKKGKKNKLTSDMIGVPANFRHVAHMGWDADKGFTQEVHQEDAELEPTIKELLKFSGFETEKLTRRDRKAIDQLAGEYGGLRRMTQMLKDDKKQLQAPGPPPPPRLNVTEPAWTPPVTPTQRPTPVSQKISKPPPTKRPPPSAPIPIAGPAVPPPPGPPPPPTAPPKAPPIPPPAIVKSPASAPPPTGRMPLLDSIEQFKKDKLKPVQAGEESRPPSSQEGDQAPGGLWESMKTKLEEMRGQIAPDSSDDEDEESSDSDWDDD